MDMAVGRPVMGMFAITMECIYFFWVDKGLWAMGYILPPNIMKCFSSK